MKKTLSILVIAIVTIVLSMGVVNAATQDFKVALSADSTRVEQGGTVVVTVTLKDFVASETGISAFIGTLDYDKTVFETVKQADFAMQNGWVMGMYNENEGSFSTTNANFMNETHELLKLTLKVKANATVGNTTITFKEMNGGNTEVDIRPSDQKLTLTVKAAATGNTNTNTTPTPTNTNTTPTPTNTNTTMPKTGVEDYILPSIAVVAVIGVIAFVRYNRMTK